MNYFIINNDRTYQEGLKAIAISCEKKLLDLENECIKTNKTKNQKLNRFIEDLYAILKERNITKNQLVERVSQDVIND